MKVADCRLSDITYDEVSPRPVIVNFENGILQPGCERYLHSELFKDGQNNRIVAVATDNLLYTGKIERSTEGHNTLLAIRNKKTNKMRLIALDNVNLSAVLERKVNLSNTDAESKEASVSALNKQFGSKRTKRQTEQKERMKINTEHIKEELQQTVEDIEIDVKAMIPTAADENSSSYRPSINRDASVIEEVYQIDKIISEGILNSLSDEVCRVLSDDEEIGACSFVTGEILKLRSSSAASREDRCKILLFTDCLMKMFIGVAKIVCSKRFLPCPYSRELGEHILNNFTVTTGIHRQRPLSMKDKTLCYILVLVASACDYHVNVEKLSKDLKLGLKKLQEVCRVLGFVSRTTTDSTMVLKLPLPPPVSSSYKGKRRK